jgi:hypothetical protein
MIIRSAADEGGAERNIINVPSSQYDFHIYSFGTVLLFTTNSNESARLDVM